MCNVPVKYKKTASHLVEVQVNLACRPWFGTDERGGALEPEVLVRLPSEPRPEMQDKKEEKHGLTQSNPAAKPWVLHSVNPPFATLGG